MQAVESSASAEGFDSVTLVSADGSTRAEFVPGANMLCCSLAFDGDELLDGGHGVRAYAERGKTMGVPLLYPWANRLSGFGYEAAGKRVELPAGDGRIPLDPRGLPIHGVLPSLLRWEVEPTSGTDQVAARLAWTSEELLELFPFRHHVLFEAAASAGELTLTTTVEATGDDPVPVSFGYHPYTGVPGIDRESWQITLGAFRRLRLDDRMIPTGEREPVDQRSFVLADANLDDPFDALAVPPEFVAAADGSALTVEFLSGYSYAQVYAPVGQQFICFEPMTAPTNALNSGDGLQVMAPGETYRAEFKIALARAAPETG
jgi:aldose 1-epimerase